MINIIKFIIAIIAYCLPLTIIAHNYTVTNLSPYQISSYLMIEAGDTIFLDSSRTTNILFTRLKGKPGKPVVIINKTGLSHIQSGSVNIRLERCHNVKITGTGDPKIEYGIKLSNSEVQGMTIGLFCDNIEVDHVEITASGFSGIAAKTDNFEDQATNKEDSTYVLKNLKLHHNYIHHLRDGEGFYIGHNAWPMSDKGKKQHNLEGIEVYANLIEYTPREAIQVGGCPTGQSKIHHNIIKHYGIFYIDSLHQREEKDSQQNNGIQLGQGFVGECYNNWIEHGTGKGMQIIGTGNVYVYNNIIIDSGEWAFYVGNGHKTIQPTAKINIYNNTIIRPGLQAIKFDPQKETVRGNFYNNLIYKASGIKDPGGKSGIFTDEKNLTAYNILENDTTKIKFKDINNHNYQLNKGSVAIDKGFDTTNAPISHPLEFDYLSNNESKSRNRKNNLMDIGAYEYQE